MPATKKLLALVRIDDQTGQRRRIEGDSDEYDAAVEHLCYVLGCNRGALRLKLQLTLAGKPLAAAGARWAFAE
ncbi:unnamed protein product [Gemmataceae bacterium]|nr:unnamed protein product [Gemmataceae bacterium]VTT96520.1 unnamed protein product [Gemmataceae bacterium]